MDAVRGWFGVAWRVALVVLAVVILIGLFSENGGGTTDRCFEHYAERYSDPEAVVHLCE